MKPIHFNKLIEDYKLELNTKLRGFNESLDYLKFWVPGSDKFASLVNLIDALFENKNYEFLIIFQKKDNDLTEKIKKLSSNIGSIIISNKQDLINVNFKIDPKIYNLEKKKNIEKRKKLNFPKEENVNEINPVQENYDILSEYSQNIEKHKIKNFRFDSPKIKKNAILLNAKLFENYSLFVKIEKLNNKIISSWHNNKNNNSMAKLTDLFCDFLNNKGIQEAAEHAVIYLEDHLRPDVIKKKISGILLPRKAGKIFFILEMAIREIFAKYKKQTTYVEKINKEYFDAKDDWVSKNEKEKISTINNLLNSTVLPNLNILNKDIKVEKIESNNKIILNISDKFKKMNEKNENLLIKIENTIKKYIDRRLEIFIVPKRDDNKLRLTNAPKE